MNRRQLIQLSLMAALAPATEVRAATHTAKDAGSCKKGLGLGGRAPDFSRKVRDLRCKWVYTWTARMPEGLPDGTDFVPMIFNNNGNRQSIIDIAEAAKKAGIKNLLGFNEPDQAKQGNMSVQQALDAWKVLQETGLRLGSPACVHPDNDWMKSFMEGAEKLSMQVDFICVHSYGSTDGDAFIRRMEMIHKLYHKPIWITEFAVGDWNAKSPEENRYKPDKVLKFMEDVLPQLEKLDFIERYAWFPAKTENKALTSSALWDATGRFTRLGECYRDFQA